MTTTAMQMFKTGLVTFTGLSSGSGLTAQGSIVGAQNITYDPALKETTAAAAGQITDSYVAIMEARPTFSLTIYDIGTLINNLGGPTELAFGSAFTCTAVTVYGCQFQEDGEVVLNSGNQVGEEFAIAQGIITLDSLDVRQGAPATAKITIHCESTDGVTHPVTNTSNVSLPAIPVLGQLYTMAQQEVNGTTLGSCNALNYSAGFKIEKPGANGQVFNTLTTVSKFDPKITISSYDVSLYGTYTGLGTALGSSSFVCYLGAMANKGTRTLAATGAHIKIAGSASQGMIWPETVQLNPAGSEIRLHIRPIVGASAVLGISVAAIS